VKGFIGKFQKGNAVTAFSKDGSYWFAIILYHKFIRNGAKIMYNPTTGCFGAMICGKIYDITGMIGDCCGWVPWLSIDKQTRHTIINR